jgi:hypothetical protein
MDPQKLSQLDPKLRDVYQRVMGTTIPEVKVSPVQTPTPPLPTEASAKPDNPNPVPPTQPQADPTPIQPLIPEPQPVTPPIPSPIPQSQPAINPQSEPQAIPTPEPISAQQATSSNFVQMNSEVAAAPTAAAIPMQNFTAPAAIPPVPTMPLKKKKNALVPVLFTIVGLIFIAIYTFFWIRFFNLKLPFLS